jgi:hypothetical protein
VIGPSGKFGTPFARMHRANRTPLSALVLAPPETLIDPQLAIAAPLSTAMAIKSELARKLRVVLMAPRCTGAAVTTG